MRRAALLSSILVAACSRAPSVPPAPQLLPPVRAFVEGRVRQLEGLELEARERVDPSKGAWKVERSALAIEAELRAALVPLLGGSLSPAEALRHCLAPGFRGSTALCPAELATIFDDGTLRVEEPAGTLASERAQPAQFSSQLEAWRASFGLPFEHMELALDALERLPDGELQSSIVLRVTALRGAEGVQQNLGWRARWKAEPDAGEPRLLELALTRFQRVHAAHPLFRELTRELCEPLPFWGEELLRGTIDYNLRQDRLSRLPWMGMHGIAVGDVDGDGLEDIYFAQPGGQPNRLLLRQKDGRMRDGAQEAGVAFLDNTGPALLADLDGDGDLDLVVGFIGSVLVYWNDGQGHFPEHDALPVPDPAEVFSIGAADVDNDGDLDLFAARYIAGGVQGGTPVPYCDAENGARNLFWRNEGGHRFVDALAEVGLDEHAQRFSLAVYFEDFDEDGWVDLLVVNDFGRNCLYHNDHGHFRDIAPALGLDLMAAGMGADSADFDGDGRNDLYLTNMQSPAGQRLSADPAFMRAHPELRAGYQRHARGNALMRARADGRFEDVSAAAGVGPGGWAWGARFVDWSNCGWPSIFVPNGFQSNARHEDLESYFWREVIERSPAALPVTEEYDKSYSTIRHLSTFEGWSWSGWQRKYAYLNLQQGRFADVAGAAQLDFLDDSRAAATIDWDDDGRLDLLLRNRTGPRLRILLGAQATQNHFLELALSSKGPNRDAIGAQVKLEAAGRSWRQSVHAAEGYLCESSRRLHFGLGRAARAEKISVRWPDGKLEEFHDVAADARYRLLEGSGKLEPREREVGKELDLLPGSHVEATPSPQSRIVLFDELPIQPLSLPACEGAPRSVSEFAGKPLLLCVGTWSDPRSRAWIEALAAARARIAATGSELRLVLLDEGARSDTARAGVQALGLAPLAGAATQPFRAALQVFLVEILGPFPDIAQPLALVIDRGGRLVVVHSAPAELEPLLADLRTAAGTDPARRTSESFLGGTWVQRGNRAFDKIATVLQNIGLPDLGKLYADCARERASR